MSTESLIQRAMHAIIDCDMDSATAIANEAIAEGTNPLTLIQEGFTAGMIRVGDLYSQEEMPLPGVLAAAEVMNRVVEILEPYFPQDVSEDKLGLVVLGTIEGDIHDIGKNIVATMMDIYGFTVMDLGRDVPVRDFVQAAMEMDADIVGTSTLMTTTMGGQRILEGALREAGIRDKVRTMVGGAATSQSWADAIGADAYAEDVTEAVRKAKELIG